MLGQGTCCSSWGQAYAGNDVLVGGRFMLGNDVVVWEWLILGNQEVVGRTCSSIF